MKFARLFIGLASIYLASASSVKRDVSTIKADIASLSSQTDSFTTAVNNFASSDTITNALANAIHTALQPLLTGFSQATSDTNNGDPLSVDDSVSVLCTVFAFKPSIISALENLIAQHGQFNLLNSILGTVEAAIEEDLKSLGTMVTNFGNALSSQTQDVAPAIQSASAEILAMVTNATSTYAPSPPLGL